MSHIVLWADCALATSDSNRLLQKMGGSALCDAQRDAADNDKIDAYQLVEDSENTTSNRPIHCRLVIQSPAGFALPSAYIYHLTLDPSASFHQT